MGAGELELTNDACSGDWGREYDANLSSRDQQKETKMRVLRSRHVEGVIAGREVVEVLIVGH